MPHSLPHAITESIQSKEAIAKGPRNNAFQHRPHPKCLRILHNRRLRRRSPDRSFRSDSTTNTKRKCSSKRCPSVRRPRSSTSQFSFQDKQANRDRRVRGRPHYYSSKKEEYAVIKFSLSADLSSLFTWNTKQIFVYVSASWPNSTSTELTNEAVIWDTIITNPSADHLQNIGPVAMKKLIRSAKGKSVDPSRYVLMESNLGNAKEDNG